MSDTFLRPPDQFGFVVPSIEDAVKHWLKLGVGPWLTLGGAMLEDYQYRGKTSRPRIDVAFSQVGKVQLELIQPVDNEASAYRDFIAAGHSGLQHFGWFIDDYDATAAATDAKRSVVQKGAWSSVHFTYYAFDQPPPQQQLDLSSARSASIADAVRKVGAGWDGKIGELIELNKTSRETFAKVAQTAADWDGHTQPVRHMLSPMLNAAYELQSVAERVERWWAERKARG